MNWRRILGWVLVIFGILVALFGLIAILGSDSPGVDDPNSVRVGGGVIIAVGLAIVIGGVFLLARARAAARRRLDPEQLGRLNRRNLLYSIIGSAAVAGIGLAVGIGSFAYTQSLDADVRSFQSSTECHPGGESNCYQRREIVISGVDVTHRSEGEVDTVHMVDAGIGHDVAVRPGSLNASVLHSGATGKAILWQGRYTDLVVEAVDFQTSANPTLQERDLRLVGFLGIGMAVVYVALAVPAIRRYRRGGVTASLKSDEAFPLNSGIRIDEQVTSYPGLPLLIRPKPISKRVRPFMLFLLPALLLPAFIFLAPFGPRVEWSVAGVLVVGLVALIAWQVVAGRNSGLFVDEMSFGTIDGFGRRKTWPRSDAVRVATRIVASPSGRTSPVPLAIVVGHDGRARTKVLTRLYEPTALGQFVEALRVPWDEEGESMVMTAAALAREIPGSVPWMVRHGTALGVTLALVLIVAIMGLMLATGNIGTSQR